MLYIVATPIGNLKDISQRALDVLASVDLIAAEDTRVSRHLLDAYQINTPLKSCHEFSSEKEMDALLSLLQQGQSIALISDAGTPLISDPGYELVRACREQGVVVSPIPGPSAMIAALSASGLACDRFSFEGFLPAKASQREKALQTLSDEQRTMVFYESPKRVIDTLAAMGDVFGVERNACFARELTKRFETMVYANLGDLHHQLSETDSSIKGECVIAVEGLPRVAKNDMLSAESKRIAQLLAEQCSKSDAARLTAQITGAKKQVVYRFLNELDQS